MSVRSVTLAVTPARTGTGTPVSWAAFKAVMVTVLPIPPLVELVGQYYAHRIPGFEHSGTGDLVACMTRALFGLPQMRAIVLTAPPQQSQSSSSADLSTHAKAFFEDIRLAFCRLLYSDLPSIPVPRHPPRLQPYDDFPQPYACTHTPSLRPRPRPQPQSVWLPAVRFISVLASVLLEGSRIDPLFRLDVRCQRRCEDCGILRDTCLPSYGWSVAFPPAEHTLPVTNTAAAVPADSTVDGSGAVHTVEELWASTSATSMSYREDCPLCKTVRDTARRTLISAPALLRAAGLIVSVINREFVGATFDVVKRKDYLAFGPTLTVRAGGPLASTEQWSVSDEKEAELIARYPYLRGQLRHPASSVPVLPKATSDTVIEYDLYAVFLCTGRPAFGSYSLLWKDLRDADSCKPPADRPHGAWYYCDDPRVTRLTAAECQRLFSYSEKINAGGGGGIGNGSGHSTASTAAAATHPHSQTPIKHSIRAELEATHAAESKRAADRNNAAAATASLLDIGAAAEFEAPRIPTPHELFSNAVQLMYRRVDSGIPAVSDAEVAAGIPAAVREAVNSENAAHVFVERVVE